MGSKSLKFLDDPKVKRRKTKKPDGRANVVHKRRDGITAEDCCRLMRLWGRVK